MSTPQIHRAKVDYSAKHIEFLDFRGQPNEITLKAAVGQFGSGKTHVCADAYLEHVAAHGVEAPGFSDRSPPRSGIVGATYGGLMDGAIAELFAQAPDGWIARHVLYGSNPYIRWANGHITVLYTAKVLNPKRGGRGPSLTGIWADEAQDDAYDERTWHNILNRPRERRAVRPLVLISGIARRGTAIETILRGRNSARQHTVVLSLEDNLHALHPGMRQHALESMPASAMRRDAEGWELGVEGAIWAAFSDANLDARDLTPFARSPRHLGVDLRQHSAVVAAVELPGDGLMLTEQLMRDGLSAEKVAREIVALGWNVGPGSTITHDPTLAEDELVHFKAAFPGARLIRHAGTTEAAGIRIVDRAVCDAAGRRRLKVHAGLERDPSRRGAVFALRSYDGYKHSALAHAADAVRYLCQTTLPIRAARGVSLDQAGLERTPLFAL